MTDFNAPWEYDDTLRAIFDADGTSVAFLPTNRHDPARARLLLKAPELLAALKMIAEFPIPEQDNMISANMRNVAAALIVEIEGGGT
jgi:hypothetical protein